ncbi:helix-turn-helix transcriptional regulator [Arthrobacter mobilis]|uniref:HTH luxR-type domain-containing protein n=1 Tax=Arthrobacter mobilis TaxID=2724944 RepID=A0A7X6HCT1_9MICC|nr:LuxR family transcriptional regulator [Arthrobacter mobilis]NKX53297.1 hypothetical protein [Arthrobacter mobilis]
MSTGARPFPRESPSGQAGPAPVPPPGTLLGEGREALERGDWNAARSCFARALAADEAPEAFHGMARAVEWAGDYEAAIRYYEAAFTGYRRRGDLRAPAMIAARELAFLHAAVYGNAAASAGWLARGVRLAKEAGDCSEAGWVDLACCLAEDSPARLAAHAAAAAATARRQADPDLEFCALGYEGLGLVLAGKVRDGMRRIDEAAAAATAGEVRDYQAAGEIYCKLLLSAELTLDVARAEEWIGVACTFGYRSNAVWIPAICGMHYGGILTAAGHWAEAEARLAASLADYDASFRALRAGTAARLAELRIRQGLLMEASALLRGAGPDPAAVLPLARLELAGGQAEAAARTTRRALETAATAQLVAPQLALLSEALLRAGHPEEAVEAGRRILGAAAVTGLPQYRALGEYVLGLAALEGAVAAAGAAQGPRGRGVEEARRRLDSAAAAFERAKLPLEAARSRLALARALALDEPGAAVAQARAALEGFEQLGARPDADTAAGLLRGLGQRGRSAPRPGGALTAREREVYRLIAEGLANAEIARRLVISKRTVEHHIGSILAKLGVATRAEAQARWAQAGPASAGPASPPAR